jgi:hypothetical protein
VIDGGDKQHQGLCASLKHHEKKMYVTRLYLSSACVILSHQFGDDVKG